MTYQQLCIWRRYRMSDLSNYKDRVAADLAAGVISPQIANQMIHQATLLASSKGDLGSNDRLALRYGHLKTSPAPPPPAPSPPPPPAARPPTPTAPPPAPINNGGSQNTYVVQTPAPSPTPQTTLEEKTTYVSTTGIKQASPDIIIFDEAIDPEFLVEAFFQEFGGTELINISRYDLINGEDVSYSLIANLSNFQQSFNSNNIISIGAYQENPTRYGIDLISRGVSDPYFNDNGDLVVEIDRIKQDESIEVEIASDGTINRIEL